MSTFYAVFNLRNLLYLIKTGAQVVISFRVILRSEINLVRIAFFSSSSISGFRPFISSRKLRTSALAAMFFVLAFRSRTFKAPHAAGKQREVLISVFPETARHPAPWHCEPADTASWQSVLPAPLGPGFIARMPPGRRNPSVRSGTSREPSDSSGRDPRRGQ